jgi:hypothetical protein
LQFRYRGSRRESAVAQLSTLGRLRFMFKITDKRRARYLLEVREQGGHRFFHFIRRNKMRYIVIIGYFGACSAYTAFIGWWFSFWVIVAFAVGSLIADLSWFRSMRKSWPFHLRTTNWDEVKRISDE